MIKVTIKNENNVAKDFEFPIVPRKGDLLILNDVGFPNFSLVHDVLLYANTERIVVEVIQKWEVNRDLF